MRQEIKYFIRIHNPNVHLRYYENNVMEFFFFFEKLPKLLKDQNIKIYFLGLNEVIKRMINYYVEEK